MSVPVDPQLAGVRGLAGGQIGPLAPRAGRRAGWQVPLGLGSAVLLGLLVARVPQVAVALAAIPVGLLSLQSAHVRLVVVVFGGILVLDSSAGFNYEKVLYLIGLALCLGAAWHSSRTTMREPEAAAVRGIAGRAWWLMLAVVAVSLPVALRNGHPLGLWLRDVAPYLMLGAVPILAADASRWISRRFLSRAFLVAGLLALASLSVGLLGARGLAVLPVEDLFFDGFLLPAGLFVFACSRAMRSRGLPGQALGWGVVAVGVLGAILLTGTRAGLLLVLAPVVMLVTRGGGLRAVRRTLLLGATAMLLTLLALQVGESLGLATKDVEDRLRSTETALRSPEQDLSLRNRLAQTRVSWTLLQANPVVGVGPGHVFDWRLYGNGPFVRAFTIDASLSTPAKFGLVGTAGLLAFFLMIARIARRVARPEDRAGLVGLAALGIGYLALSNPLEDKGLAFALLFFLALAVMPEHRPASPA